MNDFILTVRTSLRPDPDDTSPEVASLEINTRVAHLHGLGIWAKVSAAGANGGVLLGWVHADALKEITATPIILFDEPFGQPRNLVGEIIGEKVQLENWKKVRIRLVDGTVADGWIDTQAAAAGGGAGGAGQGDGGAGQGSGAVTGGRQAGDGGNGGAKLVLGPNEIYRPHLLKAEDITDIDAAAIAALIDAEAGKKPDGQWNANSQAGSSSAAGLTQFLKGTWLTQSCVKNTLLNQLCRARGFVTAANTVAAGQEAQILALRFDPEISIVTAAEYGLANFTALAKANVVEDEVGDDEKARYIYIAHHEGLGGAIGFLNGTKAYTFANLVTQVGDKAQAYVDAAGGDTTKAYRNWLTEYVDRHIQPSKFRQGSAGVSGGGGSGALAQFSGPPLLLTELSSKPSLAKAIQWRLWELGYLDPPADGFFGPVSSWALSEFCELNGVELGFNFTKDIAGKLLTPSRQLPELAPTNGWFDKVIAYMKARKYFICRHPDCKNIIYLEGVDIDGAVNDDMHNVFNDLRIVFSVDKNGRPQYENSMWEGTTEPGDYWTIHPMNPKGAARIAFNQYKAWVVGVHHPNGPSAHEALVQAEPISVYRDLNKDFQRPGDPIDTGLFAINQHWGYDASKGDLGRTSAGCLVGRTRTGHRQFMSIVKDDPRYKVNRGYRFLTAVMPGEEVLK